MLMSILPPRRSTLRYVAALCVGALAAIAHAQSTAVIPPAAESTAGSVPADPRPLGNASSSAYQVIYDASLLASIPRGSVITGLQIRTNNRFIATPTWPSAPLTIERYDITMGSSDRTPATKSAVFADNLRNPVLVRSGPLSLAAGAYPGGPSGSLKPFGPLIPFSTGFVYSGGPLVILFRVSSTASPVSFGADIIDIPGQAGEIASSVSADAAVGDEVFDDSGLVVRLTFTPPPADLAKGVTKVTVGDQMVASPADNGFTALTENYGVTQTSTMGTDQFDTIGPGSDFVGLSHRLDTVADANWPASPVTYTDFNIQLSRSNNPPGMVSDTFANNVGTDAVTVRSGPLEIPVGAVRPRAGQPVAPFSWELPFSAPYSYRGGPVYSVVRHTGRVGATADYFEATNLPTLGWGSSFESRYAFGFGATQTSPGINIFIITRYSVDAGTSSPLVEVAPNPDALGAALTGRVQVVLSAGELRYIPIGSVIDSLWLRQRAAELLAAPGVDSSALDFEISISTAANPPESVSSVFSENQGADLVLVHDGPLSVAAGALPPGTTGTFGKLAQFRRQFVYKGGPLCIDIRHSGLSTEINSLDVVPITETRNRVLVNSDRNATSGFFFASGYTGLAVKLGYIPSVISPNNLATGISFDPWILSQISRYAVQFIVPASQLRSVDVGSAITGVSLRRGTSQSTSPNPFPAAEITVPRFDVSLSTALNPPALMSNVFGENIDMDNVLVRSGPLTIPENAFPACGIEDAPNDNAWYVSFDRGFVYQGGDLCVTIRGRGVIDPAGLFEGSDGLPAEIGAAVYNYSDDDAISGFGYSPLAMRFAFTPRAFCPADLNNDGVVEDADFQIFAIAYNILDCTEMGMPFGCPSDLNLDGVVEDADFQIFVPAYDALICP